MRVSQAIGRTLRTLGLTLLVLLGVTAFAVVQRWVPLTTSMHQHRSAWSNGLSHLELVMDDGVTFGENDRTITSIAPGGYLMLEQRIGWNTRRVIFEPAPDGSPQRTYSVNGQPREWDEDAATWFANLLPHTLRETGINARERVQRILQASGVDGVLREVDQIESNGTKRVYLDELVQTGQLETGALRRVVRQAGRSLHSSGDKTEFLLSVADRYMTPDLREAYFDAADSIDNHGDHVRLLTELLPRSEQQPALLTLILRSAAQIRNNGDLAHLLSEAAGAYHADDAVRREFFRAVDQISNDGDRAHVLHTLLDTPALNRGAADPRTLAELCRAAAGIRNNGDKARVLAQIAPLLTPDQAVRKTFFDAVTSIDNNGDKAQVLVNLAQAGDLDPMILLDAARAAGSITNNGDKTHVLVAMLERHRGVPGMRDAVMATAESITSEGDRDHLRQVLRDLR